jgi:aminoglycoside 2'-N-acetyltransferase I
MAARNGKMLPTIQVVVGRDLTPDQRAAVLNLCTRAYAEDYAPFLRSFPNPTHMLAYWDGFLVSHALWITRWLRCDGGPLLRTAYVEAVATDPTYQRRGFATAIMRALQDNILDFELAALCPFNESWYAQLGWESWRGTLAIRTATGLLPTPDERVMILRLPRTPALDLSASLSAEWRELELW